MLPCLMSSRWPFLGRRSQVGFAWTVVVLIVVDAVLIGCSTWITARTGTTSWSGGFEVADLTGLQPVLDRCLAKKREDRFDDCGELRATLRPALLSSSEPQQTRSGHVIAQD